MEIREYRKEDVPALADLWLRVFGDKRELIDSFFTHLPDMGTMVLAEEAGRLLGMAGVITGLALADGSEEETVCGYLYAVAVEEDARGQGIGAALCRFGAEKARERGAGIIATLPAGEALYGWYEGCIGTKFSLRRERRRTAAAEGALLPMSTTEYLLWRESLLLGSGHLRPSAPVLDFIRELCCLYGGGFFAGETGIGMAVLDGESAILPELLCADGEEESLAAAVAASLGAREAVWFRPCAGDGERYVALDTPLPPDTLWSLTME